MKLISTLYLLLFSLLIQGQENTLIQFIPKFLNEKLEINKNYHLNGDTIKITICKFYITDLEYYMDNHLVYSSTKHAHLIDFLDSNSMKISEKILFDYNSLRFNIGVDSLTSVSGVFDGDLDPMNGMYWTWQSGYINFKFEGISAKCPARHNKFYWHIGGYSHPYNLLRTLILRSDTKNFAHVDLQIDELLNSIDITKIYHVMSPNDIAIRIADKLPSIFKIPE